MSPKFFVVVVLGMYDDKYEVISDIFRTEIEAINFWENNIQKYGNLKVCKTFMG